MPTENDSNVKCFRCERMFTPEEPDPEPEAIPNCATYTIHLCKNCSAWRRKHRLAFEDIFSDFERTRQKVLDEAIEALKQCRDIADASEHNEVDMVALGIHQSIQTLERRKQHPFYNWPLFQKSMEPKNAP